MPELALPSDEEIKKVPMTLQENVLMPKLMMPVYQYFVWWAMFGIGENRKYYAEGVIEEKDLGGSITDSKIEAEGAIIDGVVYSTDITCALIKTYMLADVNERTAILYSFNDTLNTYQEIKRFTTILHSSLSKNGKVVAVHNKNAQEPLIREIRIYTAQKTVPGQYSEGPLLKKNLLKGQSIDNIELNDDGSVCIITVRNENNANARDISLWAIHKNTTKEIGEFRGIKQYSSDSECNNILLIKEDKVSLHQRNGNGLAQLWEKKYPQFAGAALSFDGTTALIVTEDTTYENSAIKQDTLSFKEAMNGENKQGYKTSTVIGNPRSHYISTWERTAGYDTSFEEVVFVSPTYAMLRMGAYNGFLFDGKSDPITFKSFKLVDDFMQIIMQSPNTRVMYPMGGLIPAIHDGPALLAHSVATLLFREASHQGTLGHA